MIHPHFTNLLDIRVKPTNKSININIQSMIATPAKLWKTSASGPLTAFARKPVVGEPPLIQAFSATVAKPNPKVLSKNAQRKIKPIT
ncbi:MAG: hypothetical protein UU01_C0033G0005 [Parcubacteria group bacterium GW2011_GWA2_40_37]|nr:MAG: hypothetical protein UU01_C0033G0005 [Parcubacteria group bacterium GW2011_GWA2_40_37]